MQPSGTPTVLHAAPDAERGLTILMVEDDASVMEVGSAILMDCGHRVVTVATADEAIGQVRDGLAFDLLFSDIVMPGEMNGVALAGEVRRLRPDIPILLTSGWADRAQEQDEERQGFAFIGKPYRHADLSRKIQAMAEGLDGPG